MNIRGTAISGVVVLETKPCSDHRGSFARLYCEHELAPVLGDSRVVQINQSRTAAVGAIRGMHFQRPPHGELKVVRCLKGKVWDVAIDLRAGSLTLFQWHAEELSPENTRALVIPEGCAHGFQVIEPDSELLYLHTAFYMPAAEGGVRHDDPRLAVPWPLPVTDISLRDSALPLIGHDFPGIDV